MLVGHCWPWSGGLSPVLFCNSELFEESTHTANVQLKIVTKDEFWNFACNPLNDTPTHHLKEESDLQNFSTSLMPNNFDIFGVVQ
jgi:hypothetical protein